MPGSAQSFPGEYGGPAAGFASGEPLDVAPGRATLGLFLADAAGPDDRFAGVCDDELAGVICGWDRQEAHDSARKHAAVAEFIRRRPAPGAAAAGLARLPAGWDEFAARELGAVLGIAPGDAEEMLDLARRLEAGPPSTAPLADQARRPSPLGYATSAAEHPALARGQDKRSGSVVVVVEAAGDDGDHVGLDVVHEPVLLGYPA
jgi:hypothetical protein